MADRSEYNKQYRLEHLDAIKEHKNKYYQQNKEIIAEKSKEYRGGLTDGRKEEMAVKAKEYRAANNDKINVKIPCDICGSVVLKRKMAQRKQSVKCQSCIPDTSKVDNAICCDRCGKSVPKTYMWRHKQTIDCVWFPATQLNIPVKVACDMVSKSPDTLTFEEKLKGICNQYKDGYVTPIKEKKPWQMKLEQFKERNTRRRAYSMEYGYGKEKIIHK